jgi:hypothetical protein
MSRPLAALVVVLALGACADSGPAKPAAQPDGPAAVHKAECRPAVGKITIDGVLDEAAWGKAQLLTDFSAYWLKRKAKTATKARLLWDDQNLYFAAEMEDADLYADVKEHNGMCWLNDVFELFFKPSTDKLAYYEFQVNALNTQLEMFLPSRGAGGYLRFSKPGRLGMVSAVRLRSTLNRWGIRTRAGRWRGASPGRRSRRRVGGRRRGMCGASRCAAMTTRWRSTNPRHPRARR